MTTLPDRGKSAVIIFILTLVAFVLESQLTQYVQSTLQYRQPFFIFYIVHSAFAFTFPLHLLSLRLTEHVSLGPVLEGLSLAIKIHFAPSEQSHHAILKSPFPRSRFLLLIAFLTLGVTIPALLWFISVSLSPLSDVTAIWNTNAFFAYIITVRLFKLKWEFRKILAVLIATFGVLAVVYGDARNPDLSIDSTRPKAPLLGDLLTLCASVMYKRYAPCPPIPSSSLAAHTTHCPTRKTAPPMGSTILLGLWGPIVVSVGNLLTIVLVFLSDITVGQGVDAITPWNLAGSGGIVVAFGILVYDMIQH
ncbi:hypothetical protein EI94DRAFT_1768923 [Lactarius quietus]|nr:hypothetical protein EI94DRAFT_1768923 [Lactarius quietus]